MNFTKNQPPTLEPGDSPATSPATSAATSAAPAAAPRGVARRCRNAPRGRRGIGAHWHRRGEWRSVVTGGVAQTASRTPQRAWMSIASVAAIATVAGAAIGIGATRLGWLPSTGATPIVLAALAFAASGAFAILACCVELDSVLDRAPDGNPDWDGRTDTVNSGDRSDRLS